MEAMARRARCLKSSKRGTRTERKQSGKNSGTLRSIPGIWLLLRTHPNAGEGTDHAQKMANLRGFFGRSAEI